MKEGREEEEESQQDQTCAQVLGSWRRGEIPASGETGWDGREASEAVRVKQVILDSLDGVRTTQIICTVALHTPDRAAAQIWSVGIGKKSQGQNCCR